MNRLIITTGVICGILWSFISWMTFGLPLSLCKIIDGLTFRLFSDEVLQMANGFYYDVNNNDMPTIMFLILFGIIFALVFYVMVRVERDQNKESRTLWLIILFSILFRIILLPSVPIHENDIYRYLWDGKSINHGINPFKYAPADLFMFEEGISEDYYDDYYEVTIKGKDFNEADQKRLESLIALRNASPTHFYRIGHWQVPTIYPPTAQMVFAVSSFLKQDSLRFMKCIFSLFDIGALFLVIALLKHFKMNPARCIVYGWSPLVLKEFSNAGHYDPVAIFFTLLALYLFFKRKQTQGVLALAAATLSKFFSGVLAPILWRVLNIRLLFLFAIFCALPYIPFFVWDQTGVAQVFQGLHTYNEQWSYNSSVYALVYILVKKLFPQLVASLFPVKVIIGLMYLGVLAKLSLDQQTDDLSLLKKSFWATAILFIFNPVGDPWYYCWIIPFLCFFPYRSWILLSGLLILSYLNFQSELSLIGPRFLDIPILSWIIYVPFLISLIVERFVLKKYKV